MTEDQSKKYCKICADNTSHQLGTLKCKDINGELLELNVTLTHALKKVSDDFVQFAQTKKDNHI